MRSWPDRFKRAPEAHAAFKDVHSVPHSTAGCLTLSGGQTGCHLHPLRAVRRVYLVKPEKAKQVEDAILARAQRGQIADKVPEDTVIQMLQAGGGGGGGSSSSERPTGNVIFKRRDLDDDDEW